MEKIKTIYRENKSLISFLLWAFLLLLLWVLFSTFFQEQLMSAHYAIIAPQTKISSWLLELFGYHTSVDLSHGHYMSRLTVEGQSSVLVGSGCSGLELFLIFAGFIIIFQGKLKHKFWFVPVGLIIILILNIFRIAALALILYYAPEYMDFNHKYTFVILVYGVIFLLWLWWVNRFSDLKKDVGPSPK